MSWLPLSQEQLKIVDWRLNGGLGSLIGAPGTGKTVTGAAEAIMAAINMNERVLLTAFTNLASNEYCLACCKILGPEIAKDLVVRTGQLEGYQQTIKCPIPFTLDPRKIRRAQIVITTTLSATDRYLPRDIKFDRVIMDETGLKRLEHALIPLQYCIDPSIRIGIWKGWRFPHIQDEIPSEILDLIDFLENLQITATFSGDPKQSKPISPESHDYSVITYVSRRTRTETLKTTYRLPSNLDVLVDEFAGYGGLRSHKSIRDRRLQLSKKPEVQFKDILAPEPVVTFVDVNGRETQEGLLSYSNTAEAKAVVKIAKQIAECTDGKTSIMAISRYKEQCKLIKKLAENAGVCLDVRTTTGALGAEADVVLFSITRNNTTFEIGAIGVLQDLNVAISRAREKLFIIGKWEMLEEGWIKLPTIQSRGWRGVAWKLARLIDRYGSVIAAPTILI